MGLPGGFFDVEKAILGNLSSDCKDYIPRLVRDLTSSLSLSENEARNMILYEQHKLLQKLTEKISGLRNCKVDSHTAFIDYDSLNSRFEIPVKELVNLESNLQNAALNTPQCLNLNPLVVLQPNTDYSNIDQNGYPAVQPSNMQQLLILAPSTTTPVMKGPINISNQQVCLACPTGPSQSSPVPDAFSRSAGMDSNEVNMISKKFAPAAPATDDSSILEELEAFAKDFRARRIKLGFTQGDVGLSLGKMHGSDFSQTTISRFEALNLSFKNMVNLKPFLEKWIDDAERHISIVQQDISQLSEEDQQKIGVFVNTGDPMGNRRRKRRSNIDVYSKKTLEQSFRDKPHPSPEEVTAIAEALGQDRETVRIWFANRRQRERKGEVPPTSL